MLKIEYRLNEAVSEKQYDLDLDTASFLLSAPFV